MQRMGLSTPDLAAYLRGIRATHARRIVVTVMDLDGNHLGELSDMAVSGDMTGDVTQTPVRTATLTFADAARIMAFEPTRAGVPVHRSRMVRVTDRRYIPELAQWVDCAVITGPVWDFKRTGAQVDLTVHGKEQQALGSVWRGFHRAAKTRKTSIIKDLAAAYGETRLAIPDLPGTTSEPISLGRQSTYWPTMQRLAHSMNRRLYYTGSGVLTLAPYPVRPSLLFDGSWLTAEPEEARTADGVVNAIEVVGAKPKHHKKQVSAVAVLPAGHPNSPAFNAMNGQPLWLPKHIENAHLKTNAQCAAVARRERDDIAKVLTTVSLSVLPLPILDPGDLVAAVTREGVQTLRVNQWSVPFGNDSADPTAVGSISRKWWRPRG